MYGMFEQTLDRERISCLKWNHEIQRTGDPDLLCFGTADMDIRAPEPVLAAICAVANVGHLGYPMIRPSYYEAIIAWQKRLSGWEIQKEWIDDNVGIYTSCYGIIEALTDRGDEIIIQSPVHYPFAALTGINGRVSLLNPLRQADGMYRMDLEGLVQTITPRTRLMWLCNPHNPVGRAWDKSELRELGEICLAHNIVIMSDDVYCGLLYPGVKYTPIASLSEALALNTLTLWSTSKIYNTTGVRHSLVVCPNPDLLDKYRHMMQKQSLAYGKNIFGLAVAESAFNECDEWVRHLMVDVQEHHALAKAILEEGIPGIGVGNMESTYVAWVDARCLGLAPENTVAFFEKKARVIVEPGHKFGTAGTGFFRMNLATSRERLTAGLRRIVAAAQEIHS
jgi:cysteine-S-conjugate beta-lyase